VLKQAKISNLARGRVASEGELAVRMPGNAGRCERETSELAQHTLSPRLHSAPRPPGPCQRGLPAWQLRDVEVHVGRAWN
jgi:hypothetical protein